MMKNDLTSRFIIKRYCIRLEGQVSRVKLVQNEKPVGNLVIIKNRIPGDRYK